MALRTLLIVLVCLVTSIVAPRARAAEVVVSVSDGPAGPKVAKRLVGLSVETSLTARLGRYASRGNLVELMRSLGPGILRIGGNSGDIDTAWHDGSGSPPSWAKTTIGPHDLNRVANLARRTGWRVIVTVGLGRRDPAAAAQFARAASARLGHRLAGIAIGNEPDDYVRKRLRSPDWAFDDYAREFAATADAVRAAVPGVRLVGPDTALQPDWFDSAARLLQPSVLSWHLYPLAGCGTPQTLEALLDASTRDAQIRTLAWLSQVGRSAGAPVRLTEANSIGCGGQSDISDTQGSALWAVDLLLRAVENRIAGINFHGAPGRCSAYSPACTVDGNAAADGRVSVRPLWYALLLASQLRGDRLLPATVDKGDWDVDATAFRTNDGGTHVVVVNRSVRPASVRMKVSGRRKQGRALALRAPSLSSRSGVTLGGARVARDGTWQPEKLGRLRADAGDVHVRVPAGAATLVYVPGRRRNSAPPVPGGSGGRAAAAKATGSVRVTRVSATARALTARVTCPRARSWCAAQLTANRGSRSRSASVAMRGGRAMDVRVRLPRAKLRALKRGAPLRLAVTDAGRPIRVRPMRAVR